MASFASHFMVTSVALACAACGNSARDSSTATNTMCAPEGTREEPTERQLHVEVCGEEIAVERLAPGQYVSKTLPDRTYACVTALALAVRDLRVATGAGCKPRGLASASRIDAGAPATSASAPLPLPETPPVDVTKELFVVRFISPGNGTDSAAADRLKAFLNKLPRVPPFVSHRWGKEGEHDECFDLASLEAKERDDFVARIKEATKSPKVTVLERGQCHPGR
jgi:hypothetical protein